MSEKPEKSPEQKQREEKAANQVAKMLMNAILFAGSGLVTKMAWNLGFAGLFPRLPIINYGQAVSWLFMLYIASRIMAAGWMAEIERVSENVLATIEEVLKKVIVVSKPVDPVVSQTDSSVN